MKRESDLVPTGIGRDEPRSCRLWDLILYSVIVIAIAVGVAAMLTSR